MTNSKNEHGSQVASVTDDLARSAKSRIRMPEAANVERFLASVSARPVSNFGMQALVDGAGASNGIAFVQATVGDQLLDLVLRFDPGSSAFRQKDLASEFETLKVLMDVGLPVPKPMWLDRTGSLIGVPGFLMGRVPGQSPTAGLFEKGLFAECSSQERHAMMLQAAEFHGHLRALSIGQALVPHLARRGEGVDPLDRELSWWVAEARFGSGRDISQADLSRIAARLSDIQPRAYQPVLVHGDAQFANLMYVDRRISGVIDWEFAYVGYNECDVALLAYCASTYNTRGLAGVPDEHEFVSAFERASGTQVQNWEYHKAFNAFRYTAAVAVLADHIPNFTEVWRVRLADLMQHIEMIP